MTTAKGAINALCRARVLPLRQTGGEDRQTEKTKSAGTALFGIATLTPPTRTSPRESAVGMATYPSNKVLYYTVLGW